MKKVLAIVALSLLLTGCAEFEQSIKHTQSDLVGLDRVVTLYADDGGVIKQWKGRMRIEDMGGSISFVVDGKTVKIAGTFTVEEQ